MTSIPKDVFDPLKEGGLDEFVFRLPGFAPARISEVDYRGQAARDQNAKDPESSENAFR